MRKNPKGQFGNCLIFITVTLLFHRAATQNWDGIIITQADFQGLQAFKKELVDPKGFLRSWNDSGLGACSGKWAGIKCAKGQVIVIQLPWKGLAGTITDKIGQLQALRKLSLHDNMLGGSIPSSLGLLPNLRGLQLFNNRLSGSIPNSLGLCPVLQTLDVSNNTLSGLIPPSLANSTRLYWLNLSFNSLSGPIPSSLTGSKTLTFLNLQYNHLSGPLPDAIGGLLRLRVLELSHNSINGSIPSSLSNLSSLAIFNLESNNLHGLLPDDIGSLHNLSLLNLRRNRISGPIPESIGNISTLKSLDLSYNNLSDEIPDSISQLLSLTSFNVSYNNLSGPVPIRLASRFNLSSYVGNLGLCGYSPSTTCPSLGPTPAISPSHPKKSHHHKLGLKDIILIAAGSLLLVLLILCCILLCCLVSKRASSRSKEEGTAGAPRSAEKGAAVGAPGGSSAADVESGGEAGGKLVHFDGPQIFTADDLLCATAEIMGKSTYGTVYKATLEDGNQVAVKRLREKITRGHKEFEAEVNVLGKIRNPNLLPLRAYYMGPKGEKLLVFDYIPNGSLANFLHSREPEVQVNWQIRTRIIKGTTRGLIYLHNNAKIIHGNLTSSNVLIDEDYNAKISDYGLSKLMTAGASTNVIAAAGALGYRAPELSKLKNANTKTDVYSLGVIILELLTGKSPKQAADGVDLPQWVASIVKEEWTSEVFDVELMRDASVIGDELLNTLKLALHCVDPSPSARPEAQQVMQQLEEIRPEGMSSSGDEGAAAPSGSE